MTTYYAKQINDEGTLEALYSFSAEAFPTSRYFVEITEEEYTELLAEMKAEIPEPTNELSAGEALAIMMGEVVE